MYDVSNLDTFGNVRRWLQEIEQNCDDVVRILGMSDGLSVCLCVCLYNSLPVCLSVCVKVYPSVIVLPANLYNVSRSVTVYFFNKILFSSVGNKCDSPDKKVSTEEGKALASQMDIPFFETSAKDNLNIETVIGHLNCLLIWFKFLICRIDLLQL